MFLMAPLSGYSAEIDVKNSDDFISTVRLSHNIRRPEEGGKSLAVDVEISKARGNSSQSLVSGEYIQHKNVTIYGPATVDALYNATFAMLGARGGWLGEKYDTEWIGGFNLLHCDVHLKSGIRSPSERIYDYGLFFGGNFGFKPVEKLKLYGKVIASTDFSEHGYGLLSGELAAAVNLERELALFAGWRWLRFNYARQLKSNISVNISGLTVGAELAF